MLTILAPRILAAALGVSSPSPGVEAARLEAAVQPTPIRGCGMDEQISSSDALMLAKGGKGAITRPKPDPVAFQAVLSNFYPPDLIRRRIGGEVGVSFCISAKGETSNYKIIKSSGLPELDKATLDGMPLVCWEPARDARGRPVAICKPPFEMTVAWRPPEGRPRLFGFIPIPP